MRSAADFLVKSGRGLPNHQDKPIDLTYWVERNFITVEDRSIQHMLPATRAALDDLLSLGGVAAAQEACRAWQRAEFARLMTQEASLKLFGRLLLAGESAALPRETCLHLIKAYQGLTDHG